MGAFIKSATTKDEVLRAQAILLTNRWGGGRDILHLTGLTRSHVINIKQRYLKEGIGCLIDKRKGAPKELLTKSQREKIVATIKEKTPKDLGYVHEHWSTSILGDWIEKKFRVRYKSKTSLYLIFKKVSFTYHRPGAKYDERDEKAVAAWQKTATRKLAKLLKEKDMVLQKKIAIFWDNAGWHKSSVVKDFLKENGNFEVVWFPRYAPDENPQEKVWKAGRSAVTHNEYISDIDKATDMLVKFFNKTTFEYSFLDKSRIS